MYKIKNVQGGKIILGDLDLHLTNGQEIDLDNLFPREKIEASIHLRRAIDKDILQVTHKDVFITGGIDPSHLVGLENRLKDQIAKHLSGLAPQQASAPPDDDLQRKLDAIITALAQAQLAKPQSTDDATESTLDADKAVDIHSRVIERLRRNAEGHVESKAETKDSDVSHRADELEGLL